MKYDSRHILELVSLNSVMLLYCHCRHYKKYSHNFDNDAVTKNFTLNSPKNYFFNVFFEIFEKDKIESQEGK